MKLYQSLATRIFAAGELIDLTAVVEVEANDASGKYFIGPKVRRGSQLQGREIMVITPQSLSAKISLEKGRTGLDLPRSRFNGEI